MNRNQFAKGMLCIALAWSSQALATTSPIIYSFANAPASTSGYNPYAASLNYGGLVGNGTGVNGTQNGVDFGNSLNWTTGTSSVNVSAYASTGGIGGYNGTIQNAVVTQYNVTNGDALGITSRNTAASAANNNVANAEYTCSGTAATSACSTLVPNHAVDNSGAYETLLFNFNKATKLTGVTIGYPTGTSNPDSDATVLYYKGAGAPVLAGQTYAQLIGAYNATTQTGGWALAGNLFDLGTAPSYSGSITSGASAQYWMVGAYIASVQSTTPSMADSNPDYIKIQAITTSAVPEPGTIALFGIAGVALAVNRRRRKA